MMEQYKTQGTIGQSDFVSGCPQGYRVGYSDQFPICARHKKTARRRFGITRLLFKRDKVIID